jgi:hypothetical protein
VQEVEEIKGVRGDAHRRRRRRDTGGIRPAAVGQAAGSTFTRRRRFGRFPATGSGRTGWSRREGAPGGVDFAPSELEAVNRAAEFGLTGEVAAAACRRWRCKARCGARLGFAGEEAAP